MALAKNRAKINVKGWGYLKLREISPTPSDTFLDVGYLQETSIADTRPMVEAIDERGFQVDYVDSGASLVIIATVMQSDIDIVTLLKVASGRYYDVYMHGVTADGKYQELRAYCCKLKPGPGFTNKSGAIRTVPIEIHALTVKAAFTANPVAFNIAINEQYVLLENATQQGPPIDTATAVATAVL
jgi:hypothetical protein